MSEEPVHPDPEDDGDVDAQDDEADDRSDEPADDESDDGGDSVAEINIHGDIAHLARQTEQFRKFIDSSVINQARQIQKSFQASHAEALRNAGALQNMRNVQEAIAAAQPFRNIKPLQEAIRDAGALGSAEQLRQALDSASVFADAVKFPEMLKVAYPSVQPTVLEDALKHSALVSDVQTIQKAFAETYSGAPFAKQLSEAMSASSLNRTAGMVADAMTTLERLQAGAVDVRPGPDGSAAVELELQDEEGGTVWLSAENVAALWVLLSDAGRTSLSVAGMVFLAWVYLNVPDLVEEAALWWFTYKMMAALAPTDNDG